MWSIWCTFHVTYMDGSSKYFDINSDSYQQAYINLINELDKACELSRVVKIQLVDGDEEIISGS